MYENEPNDEMTPEQMNDEFAEMYADEIEYFFSVSQPATYSADEVDVCF